MKMEDEYFEWPLIKNQQRHCCRTNTAHNFFVSRLIRLAGNYEYTKWILLALKMF